MGLVVGATHVAHHAARHVPWGNIFGAVGAIAAALGLALTAMSTVAANRLRRADAARAASNHWNEPDLVAGQKVVEDLTPQQLVTEFLTIGGTKLTQGTDWWAMNKLADFFEGLGLDWRRNYVDRQMIVALIGNNIIDYWEHFSPAITQLRRSDKRDADAYTEFEYLHGEVAKVYDKLERAAKSKRRRSSGAHPRRVNTR